jgi:hypothetical protein
MNVLKKNNKSKFYVFLVIFSYLLYVYHKKCPLVIEVTVGLISLIRRNRL